MSYSNITVMDPYFTYSHGITKNVISVFVSLSFVLGVPGNVFVGLVHTKIKDKSVTDWMIFYIAVCDIVSLLNMPLFVCQVKGIWPFVFPDILCKLHIFNSNSISMAAYLFCACTSIERYFKVVRSKEIFPMQIVRYVWVPVVFVSYGLGSLAFWAVKNNANGNCSFDAKIPHFSTIAYGLVMFVAFSTSLVISISYICTGVYLRGIIKDIPKTSNNSSFNRSYKNMIQTTKMLAIVTIVFLFSANTPYFTGFVLSFVTPTSEPWMSVAFVLSITFVINNVFNPFLYLVMSTSFRQRSLDIVCSRCWRKFTFSDDIIQTNSDTT